MDNSFLITIGIIIASTLLAALIKRNVKDKCIKDFNGNMVSIVKNDGQIIKGALILESTGIEVLTNPPDSLNKSYILYKSEFSSIKSIQRIHKDMKEEKKKSREKQLKKTYHPNIIRKLSRKILNILKIIRDSLMEVFSVLTGAFSKTNPTNIVSQNQNHTTKIEKELIGTIDPSYDPILEKYIGNIVYIDYDGKTIYGVLKDYTQEFAELLNVTMNDVEGKNQYVCDMVIPRNIYKIRGLGEHIDETNLFEIIELLNNEGIKKYKKSIRKFIDKDVK